MALINNFYIFVKEEELSCATRATEHPVEKGLDITDNVKSESKTISLTGEIVGKNWKTIRNNIDKLRRNGKLIKYTGLSTMNNALIMDFKTTGSAEIKQGCSFTMTIKQIRVAKSAYKAKAPGKNTPSKGTQQVTEKKKTTKEKTERYYTVGKPNDCLWNIAKAYYGDGSKWPKIYEANKKIIKDPDIIYDGQRLLIPY